MFKGHILAYASFLSEPQDSRVQSSRKAQDRIALEGRRQCFLLYMISVKSNQGRPLRGDKGLALCIEILHVTFTTVNSKFSRTCDGSVP